MYSLLILIISLLLVLVICVAIDTAQIVITNKTSLLEYVRTVTVTSSPPLLPW